MKRLFFSVAALSVAFLLIPHGALQAGSRYLPDFDQRHERLRAPPVLDAAREAGAERLRAKVPAVRIALDDVLGSPRVILNPLGFLSGPWADDEMERAGTEGRQDSVARDPEARIRQFLDEHAALFGHDSSVLETA